MGSAGVWSMARDARERIGAPSGSMLRPGVNLVRLLVTRGIRSVASAAVPVGCLSARGDYESSLSLAALLPIPLPMQRSEVTRTLCAAFCDWVTVVNFPPIFALGSV